ncbi:unconventional myosin-XV isoform X2 [Drosophila rhopaloa]|uniref:Unconventional myosin-XV n=1 Tax=Drosophila rhopaloa TaxID=1041015 RepID=A0ABM5JER3_DRORH|nr:unconventional myosin-XV isoform X2 [Drosophila rhopaloa]XP_044317308.1 unconventional myosin-XV isoform X2 [Drosophila rhopaloa]XP_044317309.1 unconventional myosin-XV isoform X2 [Drosophila rhopaloa]
MSQSVRASKSCQAVQLTSGGGSVPHKFSSIVNKVESLISKMHHDKVNNFKLLQQQGRQQDEQQAQDQDQEGEGDGEQECKCASLDSLNNLTDEEHEMLYTDSDDAEIAHITGTTAAQVHHAQMQSLHQQMRRSDLDQLTNESIRELNEQCCASMTIHQGGHPSGADGDLGLANDNAWSVEEDIVYKCCATATLRSTSSAGSLCEQCCLEEQLSFKMQLSQRDDNNNEEQAALELPPVEGNSASSSGCSPAPVSAPNLTAFPGSNPLASPAMLIVGSSKTRRVSNASSGSVSRMETILEEPTESKISVKEILARFETMNSNESQSKGSTLSSGARAAAQTLNVPLERLESRQAHAQRNEHGVEGGSRQIESLQQQVQQADLHHHLQLHQQQQQLEDALEEQQMAVDHQQQQQQQQGQQQRFLKQQSYLHSARKSNAGQQPSSLTNGQVHQQEQLLQQQQQQSQSLPHHDLDANYLQEEANGGTPPSVTKYSLLQFAMQHFRNDQLRDADRHHERHQSAANRSYAELVKWQGHAIRLPLLRLPNDLAPLALECFDCILRYCGDIPLDPDLTEVKCVYTVLMHCHKYLALRDEVYCQLMKQTTANRSPCPDSSQRAWRLLSILAAYFGCSDALRPYLMEHLTSAASDRRRSCHGTAAVCLTNLRKTARCGGRKNVPSVEEVTAVSAGRSARRQIYRLPGGAERVVNTRCSTVVADVIAELCALLGVESEAEQQEFSLYCIVQGDAFTMPLAADEYILDVTTELLKSGQPFYLIFCRSVWHFALKREPAPMPLYVEVLFNQVAPDYLEGLLLELPGNGVPVPEMVRDMARIAALLHRAADLSHVPAMKEIKFLLPKPALGIREIRPAQWVGLVQSAWPQVANLSPGQVKAQFLNVLATWPLFGSSFFAVKRIWAEEGPHVEDNHSPMWRDLILALNRRGVLFLDPNTHETLQHWSFMEVISTRKVRSEDGALFLDMKVGNLMQQRVIRVQTEQAHEISRLVRQYITMAQISQRDKRELN